MNPSVQQWAGKISEEFPSSCFQGLSGGSHAEQEATFLRGILQRYGK